jgi:hypothetical protein
MKLSPTELGKLKRSIKRGTEKRIFIKLRASAGAWLRRPPVAPPPHPSTQDDRRPAELIRSRTSQNCLLHCSLMYKLSGERRFLERAWKELECWMLQWESWCDPFHGDRHFFDLMTGEIGMSLAFCFEWLKDDLSPARRGLLTAQLRARVLDCYLKNTLDAAPGKRAWWEHRDMNWNPVCHGGAAMAAVALREEFPRWKEVCAWARRCMAPYFAKMARFEASEEGLGYWQYGMRYGLFALESMRRVGLDPGPWLDAEGTGRSCYSVIEFAPGMKAVSFGDAVDVVRSAVMHLAAARFRNGDFLDYADQALLSRPKDPPLGLQGWDDSPLALILRPSRPLRGRRSPASPARAFACAYPKIGWACAFDGWKKPEWIVGFKCGDLGANHTQLDNLSYQIFHKGEALAEDLGTGVYNQAYFSEARWKMYKVATRGHNSLLLNGQGQLPHTLGTLRALHGKGLEGWSADATACYPKGPALRVQRHFLILEQSCFLILDDVLFRKSGKVDWLLHTFKPVQGGQAGPRIQGKKGALSLSAPGLKFGLRKNWVEMSKPGAKGVTDKPVPKLETILSLQGRGKRVLLPVAMAPGSKPAKILKMDWKGRILELDVQLPNGRGKKLNFFENRSGLKLSGRQ